MSTTFLESLAGQTEALKSEGLFKSERLITGPQQAAIDVRANGGTDHVLNLCANNYLGLANHPEVIEAAHKRDLKVFMHSCGNVTDIIPDLIEIGLDVLNPIQPGATDHEHIAREFGGKITFFGGIDVQGLPKKSTAEIEEEIDRLVEFFGRYDGGFIFCTANSVVPETPLQNIEAMLKACQRYFQSSFCLL